MPLDPELAVLLDFLAQSGDVPMWEQTPAQARASFRTLSVDLRDPALLPPMASVEDITIPSETTARIPARVYRPDSEGARPTVVLFHGGGWVIGDLDTHDLLARTLATGCDAVVVSVDYRLAPEHRFPAAVEDAIAATTWAGDHLAELGGTERLGVAGDSAGGNLAAVVAQRLRERVSAQLLAYPGTDVPGEHASRVENGEGYFLDALTMAWFLQQYVEAGTDLTDPLLSPIYGRLEGVAAAVVVVADLDPLRDDGLAYARALEAAAVPVELRRFEGLIHGFLDMGRHSKAAQAAVEETCVLFRKILHG